MKRALKIILFILAIIAILLVVATIDSDKTSLFSELFGISSKNLLVNADFQDNLKGWKCDENIFIVTTNGINKVFIKGNNRNQTRIWQEINVISGQTYNLTFTLSGPSTGGFAIFRDDVTREEQYLWCNDKNGNKNKHYKMLVEPTTTGNHRLFLSTCARGDYYYSNVKFKRNNEKVKFIYFVITIFIILLLSRYQVMMFFIVFFLALVPVMKMTDEDKSVSENRALAEYKPLFNETKELNKNFGSDFNNWLNDHFLLRSYLIKYYSYGNMIINNRFENKSVFPGRDKFYFGMAGLEEILNFKYIKNEEYQATLASLKRFRDFCNSNGIDIYIVFVPYGLEVYKEKCNGINLINYAGQYSNTINRLKNDLDMNLFYLFDELNSVKNEHFLYYKTDHHWTPFAAYKGYRFLVRKLAHKYPGLKPSLESNYDIKDKKVKLDSSHSFFRQLNLDKKYYDKAFGLNDTYLEYEYKDNNSISGKWNNIYTDKSSAVIYNKKGYDKKVFLFGDSYLWYCYSFFTHTFSQTFIYSKRLQIYMPDIERIILDKKPDIVITYIYAGNIRRIKYWYTKGKLNYD